VINSVNVGATLYVMTVMAVVAKKVTKINCDLYLFFLSYFSNNVGDGSYVRTCNCIHVRCELMVTSLIPSGKDRLKKDRATMIP
jgi:hypothetical protein